MKQEKCQQPKMKLPVLKFFKLQKFWQKQKFSEEEKLKIKKLASKIDKILKTLPAPTRNQLVRAPNPSWDPTVAPQEWSDFLAVVLDVKPSCIIGTEYNGATYNPIAQLAKNYPEVFRDLSFADYWQFGLWKKNRRSYDRVKDGFIFKPQILEKIIKKYPRLFNGAALNNLALFLKRLVLSENKNRAGFHLKLGLLLGYSPKNIEKFIENEKKYYH